MVDIFNKIMKNKLNNTIELLEQSLKYTDSNNYQQEELRANIIRAINEAKYVNKKQLIKTAKKENTTILDKWQLDLKTNKLINPRQQKIAISALDKLIESERQKLENLEHRKNTTDAKILPQKDSQNMGMFFD